MEIRFIFSPNVKSWGVSILTFILLIIAIAGIINNIIISNILHKDVFQESTIVISNNADQEVFSQSGMISVQKEKDWYIYKLDMGSVIVSGKISTAHYNIMVIPTVPIGTESYVDQIGIDDNIKVRGKL